MTELTALAPLDPQSQARRRFLFLACFVALVATAFAFAIRSFILDDLRVAFNLSETQKGEINGAGFWPFGISIVVFSLVVDRIGYGKSMIFAFACHVASVFVTVFATGYWHLYLGAALCGLAAGTVEAVVNPVVASMYTRNKTTMLTILHGGWAGGVCLGGVLTLLIGGAGWEMKVFLLLIPTGVYGLMMLFCKFPISERVAAGVPYRDMLKEAGALSILIVSFMIFKELGARFSLSPWYVYGGIVVCTLVMLGYTRSLGRPMYVFLLLVMILLAITELGTDGWIKDLMGPAMKNLGFSSGGWVLVYTSFIMMVLRFVISPFVKALKPLGVLLMGSLFAAAGLFFLSGAQAAWWLLITATIYGIGQAFFWPVTLGVVAERFPKGGALTLNAIAGVGMLGVGILGLPLLGNLQDREISRELKSDQALYAQLVDPEQKISVFGRYQALDSDKTNLLQAQKDLHDLRGGLQLEGAADLAAADLADSAKHQRGVRDAYDLLAGEKADRDADHATMVDFLTEKGAFISAGQIEKVEEDLGKLAVVTRAAKRNAMATIALLPLIMAGCYLGLILYFRAKGGYKAIELTANGEPTGEHAVTPTEVVAGAEETPSE